MLHQRLCDEVLKQIESHMYAKQLEEDYDEVTNYK